MNIADDLVRAFNDGYAQGKADAENYAQHCGDTDAPFTNAARIRMMTDEELADFLWGVERYPNGTRSINMWLGWLKQEIKQ